MRKIIAFLFMVSSLIASAASFASPKVEFKTTMGSFVVELDSVKAPKTTANFLNYVNSGFYNGTIFHRVIDGFMIQGGGFTSDLNQKPTNAPVVSEAQNGLKNQTYTIAMARTSDPDSATAQFFINVKDNEGLNYPNAMGNGYTVFGKVIFGTQTIDAIRKIPTMIASAPKMGRMSDVPSKTVTIESATVLK
ncbi:MAG: peptidylprolyl isomerase [Polynucleobacter sp. 24-46-87]|uniref:peptidylprolyl isomerase n=1 Tax=unclassified Polynucleobacter TaxID=2640945 RepID=UPI000BD54E0C|nr:MULTISPECIES: peptidylprolyl isomerase [unclassified Polynucleobacter]OYY21640.1 MAG: peptidylprolyl isomerase [Polynucleobacter sp. 35-46-11]OZA14646.1 MAG: peptidylprolyl isomerase [Polynucleobacter sp. 24-46-87]OZA76096.1 MAG: peptidylprolyl isomerase [Polynucleobacter sp. 39-46-10]